MREQLEVERGEALARQAFARFGHVVDAQLELGEHGLAEEGAAELLHLLAEIEELLLARPGVGRRMWRASSCSFTGRGDLGGEGGIVRGLEGLARLGEQGVDRMAPFMGVGGKPLIILGEVEQQIGVHVIGAAAHIGAGRLALAREGIHPARRRAAREQPAIFGAERAHRLQRGGAHVGAA